MGEEDPTLVIDHRVEGTTAAFVIVRGDLDFTTSPQLVERLPLVIGELRRGAVCRLELDHVGFADSSGLRCLLECARSARAAGVALHLSGLNAQVRRLLEVTDTFTLFDIVDDGAD